MIPTPISPCYCGVPGKVLAGALSCIWASIAGIDQEMYEAARVDGAGRFQLMRYITLPELMPTYFVMLMLSVANFLNNGMDQYFVFQNAFQQSTYPGTASGW